MESLPSHVETVVPHVQQAHHWDCGLACARMILRYLGKEDNDFHEVCKSMQFGDSVWTIDLAKLMVHYGIKHHFSTITLGVDKGFSSKGFYKSHFDKDEVRVNDLFENSDAHGLTIEKGSLPLGDILRPISKGHLVVALVDWSYLSCRWCDHKCLLPSSFGCMGKCLSPYQGHFIVVCGYDTKDHVVYYKNPSRKEELCCSSMKHFDQARRSYGTDEDVLIVYKEDHETSDSASGDTETCKS